MYLGATACDNADLTAEIHRRAGQPTLQTVYYSLPPCDRPTAPLRFKVRMLKAEGMEAMLYGCVTWSPTVARLAILRTAHHRLLLRCIGRKGKPRDGYHMVSYADALAKTGCENVETTVRKRRVIFAGCVARMGNTRDYPTERCLGNWRGELVTWEGKSRTDWALSNATCRCLTRPPKRNYGRWQRRNRASGSGVSKKRQSSK